MRYIGIDFGMKRIGVALSDQDGDFAMPHSVIENGKGATTTVAALAKKECVGAIVIGRSLDYKGAPNPIMRKAQQFAHDLEKLSGLAVLYENEFLTSAEAERIQGKTETLDASAAALILKSFLDTMNREIN